MSLRVCRLCGKEKDLESSFPKNKRGAGGYRNQCKMCRNLQYANSYSKKAVRQCMGCKQILTLNMFKLSFNDKEFSWTCNACKQEKDPNNNLNVKACIRCGEILPSIHYSKGDGEYNRRGTCRRCIKVARSTPEDKKRRAETSKKYLIKNKDKIYAYGSLWAKKNKEKTKSYYKKYKSNPDTQAKIRKHRRERYYTDVLYRIKVCLRARLFQCVSRQKKHKKVGSSIKYLGCTAIELKQYLESKFYDRPSTSEPMTWDNHSQDGWHIDHIIPLSSFDLTQEEEVKKACHYTNLQPLWSEHNRLKGDKVC